MVIMSKPLFTARELCLVALFAALTAVFAQIVIPLPFTPLPISFGLVAVYLTGMFLPPKCAIAVQVIYLIMGGIGLPVFGGFQGGPARLLGPTGGCLFAYPFMAAVISIFLNRPSEVQRLKNNTDVMMRTNMKAFLAVSIALTIEYLFATLWLSFTMGISFVEATTLTVVPFIVIDIVKVVVTVLVFIPVRKQLYKAGLIAVDQKSVVSETLSAGN